MKKWIIIIVTAISFLSYGQQAIPLNAEFGGNRCNGSIGICSISHIQTEKGGNIEMGKYSAHKVNNVQFQLIIDRIKISENEELGIVGKKLSTLGTSTVFRIEEDYILDSEVVEAIGLKPGYIVILKGEYPMTIDSYKAYINFTVEKLQ